MKCFMVIPRSRSWLNSLSPSLRIWIKIKNPTLVRKDGETCSSEPDSKFPSLSWLLPLFTLVE